MTQNTNIKHIHFELLENGLDFLLSGIEYLARGKDKRDIKYGVLHTVSGVELILKERLRREHWSLLFRDPGDAEFEAFRAGTFQSVAFEPCIERLQRVCLVDLEHKEKTYLLNLRDKRNRLEHFGIVDKLEAIMGPLARVLSIVLDFINEELEPDEWSEPDRKALSTIRKNLGEIKAFVDSRVRLIASKLESIETVFTCPVCLQEALVPDDECVCHFCGYSDKAESVADQFVESVLGVTRYRAYKDGAIYPLHDCPGCERETLVDIGFSEITDQYICFACGNTFETGSMRNCSHCGRKYLPGPGGMFICDQCFEYQVQKDD